jgi:hypothetical protein
MITMFYPNITELYRIEYYTGYKPWWAKKN